MNILSVLLVIYLYIIVRYCVSNVVRDARITTTQYTLWLLAIIFLPFLGYILYLRWLSQKLA